MNWWGWDLLGKQKLRQAVLSNQNRRSRTQSAPSMLCSIVPLIRRHHMMGWLIYSYWRHEGGRLWFSQNVIQIQWGERLGNRSVRLSQLHQPEKVQSWQVAGIVEYWTTLTQGCYKPLQQCLGVHMRMGQNILTVHIAFLCFLSCNTWIPCPNAPRLWSNIMKGIGNHAQTCSKTRGKFKFGEAWLRPPVDLGDNISLSEPLIHNPLSVIGKGKNWVQL